MKPAPTPNLCHYCDEPVPRNRSFCSQAHRDALHNDLAWYDRPLTPPPRHNIRQYIIHATTPLWRQLPPWRHDDWEIRGFQKRTFLHE